MEKEEEEAWEMVEVLEAEDLEGELGEMGAGKVEGEEVETEMQLENKFHRHMEEVEMEEEVKAEEAMA